MKQQQCQEGGRKPRRASCTSTAPLPLFQITSGHCIVPPHFSRENSNRSFASIVCCSVTLCYCSQPLSQLLLQSLNHTSCLFVLPLLLTDIRDCSLVPDDAKTLLAGPVCRHTPRSSAAACLPCLLLRFPLRVRLHLCVSLFDGPFEKSNIWPSKHARCVPFLVRHEKVNKTGCVGEVLCVCVCRV